MTGRRSVAVAGVLVGILFAVFDIAEVVHQLDESKNALAAVAVAAAVGHLMATAGAGWSAWGSRPAD